MDGRLKIHCGDCRDILPSLEAESVQCCVTSPPYWGLRDYGTAQWEGGDEGCDHKFDHSKRAAKARNFVNGEGRLTTACSSWTTRSESEFHRDCPKCGARRIDSQLGLEATPEEYIAKMVAVFREVWRVLRDDGTCWINLGDSYASGGTGGCSDKSTLNGGKGVGNNEKLRQMDQKPRPIASGLKPKDLCMMPARLAMALQADGWYLRSDIIWAKPNPMPESVTDRPTKAHEYIFLLTKNERYFYDAEAIREPDAWTDHSRNVVEAIDSSDGFLAPHSKIRTANGRNGQGRNKRTVWTIPSQPYAEAHFATFPEEIPKLCILAGSKPGDTVLDPFAGSGTVGKVALELGRKAILIELNPEYIRLIKVYTAVTVGWF